MDSGYIEWLGKWENLHFNWCVSDEVVVQFIIRAIIKKKYTPDKHADFARAISESIGTTRICKDSTITVCTKYSPVSASITCDGLKADEFGIVTFTINFLSRPDILRVCICLEELGHGVIHNGGIVSSNGYNPPDTRDAKRKMPHRCDPIWSHI